MSGDREKEREREREREREIFYRSSIGSVPVSFIFINASFFPQHLSPADVLYESEFICYCQLPLCKFMKAGTSLYSLLYFYCPAHSRCSANA